MGSQDEEAMNRNPRISIEMKTYQHWINGDYVAPSSGLWLDTQNPSQGMTWARIASGNAQDADRAVAAARDAMYNGPGSRMVPSQRGKVLRRIGDLLAEPRNARFLAEVESRDNGRILAELHGQLRYLPEHWHYYAALADKIQSTVVSVDNGSFFAWCAEPP